jgi:hypothetical protein
MAVFTLAQVALQNSILARLLSELSEWKGGHVQTVSETVAAFCSDTSHVGNSNRKPSQVQAASRARKSQRGRRCVRAARWSAGSSKRPRAPLTSSEVPVKPYPPEETRLGLAQDLNMMQRLAVERSRFRSLKLLDVLLRELRAIHLERQFVELGGERGTGRLAQCANSRWRLRLHRSKLDASQRHVIVVS